MLQLYSFSPKTASGPDLDGAHNNYLHKILATEDRRQFDLAATEFVGQLHNGHFFWDAWLDRDNNRPLGFYAAPLNGKWVVHTSSLDSLKRGDVISSVDSTSIETFFLQQQRYISASSTAAQRIPRCFFVVPQT